jgi:enoyl-CoA hydratase
MRASTRGSTGELSPSGLSMSEPYQTIRLENSGAVALLTLARPERANAIDKRMLGELQHALDAVERDEQIRVLVVKGAGGNFSSGFDLKEQMETRPSGFDTWRQILDRDFSAVTRFWHLKKPTIAAVQGYCLAGGCELALCCDITIAAEDAIFGEPELKFGAGIVVMILPWLVGPKRAKEIILAGADRIAAPEALRIGLVNRVVPSDQVETAALALARHIAVIDPALVQATKQAINHSFEVMGLIEALDAALDIDLAIEGNGSDDKRAFMEIARKQGLRQAIAWRDARFGGGADG